MNSPPPHISLANGQAQSRAEAHRGARSGGIRLRTTLARHPWLGGAIVATIFFAVAFATAHHLDMPIRDPEGTIGPRLIFPFSLLLAFLAVDVLARVWQRRHRMDDGWQAAVRYVFNERWPARRFGLVLIGFISFHVTYLAYRNLKSFLPLLTDANWDKALTKLDVALLFGTHPAEALHAVLGTGISAQALASVYLIYLVFVPISVAAALMWTSSIREGFVYVTALNLNWILGTISYYSLPSLGPVYVDQAYFGDLPHTGVTALQGWLLEHRITLRSDPMGSGDMQSIAAFASLHVSVVFTAVLMARRLCMKRLERIAWVFLGLTAVSTLYFGWHYIADDIAGLLIGWLAMTGALLLTGHVVGRPRPLRAIGRQVQRLRRVA